MKHLLTVLLLSFSTFTFAQLDTTSAYNSSPVFAHIGVGTIVIINLEVSAAVGYRFNRHVGAGLEYRSTAVNNSSFGSSANLLGVHLRGQLDNGLFASLGGGLVLDAGRGDDGFFEYTYREGGNYLAVDLGYQFRPGITLGVFVTGTGGQTFDVAEYSFDTETYEPTRDILDEGLFNLGFKLGYAFPRRGKRL